MTDINEQTLLQHLTQSQVGQVMGIARCLPGVSTGQGIIIGLLSILPQRLGVVNLDQFLVSELPLASSSSGNRVEVTNALSPSIGSTVTGGGSETVTVRSNGSNWIVIEIL